MANPTGSQQCSATRHLALQLRIFGLLTMLLGDWESMDVGID